MSESKQRILDSHVHLWPVETANETGHRWMPPGMPLAKAHLPSDYDKASRGLDHQYSKVELRGFVFVESDVRYEISDSCLSIWAKGPLDEITFARTIVEGEYGDDASSLCVGIVAWAPVDQSATVLNRYLQLARERAGESAWKRTKGFRYLVQSITDKEDFKALVMSDRFISNLRLLGKKGFCFDIGVDQHSCGIWQLEYIAEAMAWVHQGVEEGDKTTFIINHLCKPDFSTEGAGFTEWCIAISSMSKLSRTFMKLSGAFSELPLGPRLSTASEIGKYMRPWIAHVLKCFGPSRLMFGCDWPVCNLKSPSAGDSWIVWKDVVDLILEDGTYGLGTEDKDCIWYKTAEEAYQLQVRTV